MKAISLKNITLSFLTLFVAATLLVSCSKKSNDVKPPSTTSHKVTYKATTTDGAINIITYTNAQGDETDLTSLNVTSYTSPEITVPASQGSIIFAATGTATSTAATITVQIYVDGKVVKSNTNTGASLSASTSYIF